jgi:L-ascorbate metabolism protein UlaG (beta-lactamase superfamily)
MKISLVAIIILSVVGLFLNQSCSSSTYSAEDTAMNKINTSPQYTDGKFNNYVEWDQPSFLEYLPVMWDFIFTRDHRSPDGEVMRKPVDLKPFNNRNEDHLSATWIGHSSLLINIDGYKILMDPVFEKSVSFFGPTRYNGEVPFDINQLKDIDVVAISHNHYDHLNKFSIQFLNEKTKQFIVPLMVGAQLRQWGVPSEKIVELDWWDEFQVSEKLMIAATPAQHFSGRSITDRDETLWVSYVVKGPQHKVYFSGDGGYSESFKMIGDKYGPFDINFIETGAYDKRWDFIHMFPEESVQAHLDLGGEILHPIHWGTFNLALHSWFDPMERLVRAADSLGVTAATPIVGETTIFGSHIPQHRWWEKAAAKAQ